MHPDENVPIIVLFTQIKVSAHLLKSNQNTGKESVLLKVF